MTSLAEIRARLEAQESNTQGTGTRSDNAIYPHWNIPEGSTATLRFLPDGNPENVFFWVERQMIKLPFNGVKGDPNVKHVQVQVPCVEMFGDNCPILAEVRPWYKDESLKELANKYWKKRTYLFQGFVRNNPLTNDEAPENPIRRFIVSPQIIPIIKNGLMDPEIDELPTDYVKGLDFNIRKTAKSGSQYADYTTSSWARKESSLTEAEQAAIETYGLFNLTEFLPKKPSEAELRVIKELFEASVDGLPYDPDKWGAYYRPAGMNLDSGNSNNSASTNTSPDPVVNTNTSDTNNQEAGTEENAALPNNAASDKAADILAIIKARKNSSA